MCSHDSTEESLRNTTWYKLQNNKLFLSAHLPESNQLWLQHGVNIRGDQKGARSFHPEVYMLDDVILRVPLSVSLSVTLWCPNCLEYFGAHRLLKATRWKYR